MKTMSDKKVLLAVGVVVVLASVLYVFAQSGGHPASKVATPVQNVQPLATPKTRNRGGGGGGSSQAIVLPSDLPPDVPLPTGTLAGTSVSSPRWALLYVIPSSFDETVSAVRSLYISRGYRDLVPGSTNLSFANSKYAIQLAPESRDHSATNTNLTIEIERL